MKTTVVLTELEIKGAMKKLRTKIYVRVKSLECTCNKIVVRHVTVISVFECSKSTTKRQCGKIFLIS